MKTIRTITPSWLIKKKKDFSDGMKNLAALGFEVVDSPFLTALPGPREKARQIHAAFRDKHADIVLAQRGGYSSMKVLPCLDFQLIKKNPKLFAGFSDASTMLNAIYERTGMVTLHSPMVINFSSPSRFTVKSFLNAVDGFPEPDLFAGAPVQVYRHGVARGTLKGGNLITLTALIDTAWEIKTDGAILFLEDVDEKLHAVDRYLTQWILAGKLKGIQGLILGDFRGIRNREVFAVLAGQMKIPFPVVHCPWIGHVKNKITLPVGATVKLDTRKRRLELQ